MKKKMRKITKNKGKIIALIASNIKNNTYMN